MLNNLFESDELYLFLLLGGTPINENESLNSLETTAELIAFTEEQMHEFPIYFNIKKPLQSENISSPININYFLYIKLRMSCFAVVFFYIFVENFQQVLSIT